MNPTIGANPEPTELVSIHDRRHRPSRKNKGTSTRLQHLLLCTRIIGSPNSENRRSCSAAGLISGDAPVVSLQNQHHHQTQQVEGVPKNIFAHPGGALKRQRRLRLVAGVEPPTRVTWPWVPVVVLDRSLPAWPLTWSMTPPVSHSR
jgi:hypothetical protein